MFLSTLLAIFLFTAYWVLILYYRVAWQEIPSFPPAGGGSSHTRISVLVPARNEEKNIGRCLDSLWRQSYPRELFEVIIIDDHSTDGTASLVGAFREEREGKEPGPSIRLLPLGEIPTPGAAAAGVAVAGVPAAGVATAGLAGKKGAIEAGVGMSTGSLIVTTDADCWFPADWLATIARFYETTGARFIAAPVRIGGGRAAAGEPPHRRPRRSILFIFQTLDFITLQGITGAAVYKRAHSMCNGANLAYEKKVFYEVGGFEGIDSLPSGDDMLLMHKIYKKYPGQVFFLKSRQAIVDTAAAASWRSLFHQRVRWASKADRYDDRRIFWVLLLVYIVNALFVALAVAACWNAWWLGVLLVGLLIKTLTEYPFVRSAAAFFGQQGLMVWFPLMQPLHILYTVVVGWLGKFGSYHWKDRKINK